jgi:hypothetical protein
MLPHIKKNKQKLSLPSSQNSLCIFYVFRAQMGEEFLQELKVVCYTVVCSYLYVWNSHSAANGFTIDKCKSTGQVKGHLYKFLFPAVCRHF